MISNFLRIEKVRHYFKVDGNTLIFKDTSNNVVIMSLGDQSIVSTFRDCYNFSSFGDKCLLGLTGNDKMSLVSIKEKREIKRLDYDINLPGIEIDDCIYSSKIVNGVPKILIFSFSKEDIIGSHPTQTGLRFYINEALYGFFKESKITVFAFVNNAINWESDIADLNANINTNVSEAASINSVYVYQNLLITIFNKGIIAFVIDNGHIGWQKWNISNYKNLEITGDTGYINSDFTFAEVNLRTGEIKNEIRLADIRYETEQRMPLITKMIFHNDFLWCCSNNGPSYLLAIDPKTGDYILNHHIPTSDDLMPPVINEERIFVLDQGGVLRIFKMD